MADTWRERGWQIYSALQGTAEVWAAVELAVLVAAEWVFPNAVAGELVAAVAAGELVAAELAAELAAGEPLVVELAAVAAGEHVAAAQPAVRAGVASPAASGETVEQTAGEHLVAAG